jgi:hypothetical protein
MEGFKTDDFSELTDQDDWNRIMLKCLRLSQSAKEQETAKLQLGVTTVMTFWIDLGECAR